MLGHTKISTPQIYAKVVEQKVSQDMMKLQEKLSVIEFNKKSVNS
jgi:integrase/recombinase XerD